MNIILTKFFIKRKQVKNDFFKINLHKKNINLWQNVILENTFNLTEKVRELKTQNGILSKFTPFTIHIY